MAPQAARFHREANRYRALAEEATTGHVKQRLTRLAQHYRSIAEELEPFLGEAPPRPADPPLAFRPAPAKPNAPATPDPAAPDGERRVRERAYAIWEREGRPHGRDRDHWYAAEREIAAEDPTG